MFNKHCKAKFHVGLRYSYTLWVNGKTYRNFVQSQSKVLDTWSANVGNDEYRIVLGRYKSILLSNGRGILTTYCFIDKQTQNIWVNGEQLETEVRQINYFYNEDEY